MVGRLLQRSLRRLRQDVAARRVEGAAQIEEAVRSGVAAQGTATPE